jgi:hypothetical protein
MANNAGAILVLGRDLVVVPKLIHPIPPAFTSPESSPEHHLEDTWMQVYDIYGLLVYCGNQSYHCYLYQMARSLDCLQSLQ